MAAVLLIGNLFLIVGLLLVDSTVVRLVLLAVAVAMLAGGIMILSRHAARLKAIHATGGATVGDMGGDSAGGGGQAPDGDGVDVDETDGQV
ncbi:MAG TPA: hypothetical protein VJ978_13460 [Nitriliruptoraceae bacterium]|nr:hypothetical protein [Nitriliruptoraceae bacterium]